MLIKTVLCIGYFDDSAFVDNIDVVLCVVELCCSVPLADTTVMVSSYDSFLSVVMVMCSDEYELDVAKPKTPRPTRRAGRALKVDYVVDVSSDSEAEYDEEEDDEESGTLTVCYPRSTRNLLLSRSNKRYERT